ncbi:MAG: hypothetical protein KGH76_06315 [Thaumarchaeota archaeon]|nr:hypothetical protein [Nitrososphaerota archaeon]
MVTIIIFFHPILSPKFPKMLLRQERTNNVITYVTKVASKENIEFLNGKNLLVNGITRSIKTRSCLSRDQARKEPKEVWTSWRD